MIFLLEVQSKEFSVKIDELTGATFSLSLREDPHHMNWVGGPGTFGVPCLIPQRIGNYDKRPNGYPPASPLPFVSAQKRNHDVVCVFEDKRVRVTVTKGFRENGRYFERYHFENVFTNEEFFCRGDLAITASFSDMYDTAGVALKHCCHAHIWCGGDSSYVQLTRMGVSELNVGMMVTEGDLSCYSVNHREPMDARYEVQGKQRRGMFLLHPGPLVLDTENGYTLEFEFFSWKNSEDFKEKLRTYDRYVEINAPTFTPMGTDCLEFSATVKEDIRTASVLVGEEKVPFELQGNKLTVSYPTDKIGEVRFDLKINGINTHTRLMSMCDFETLLEKRAHFIVQKQQYLKPGSPLDGAYMIYDNEDGNLYYDTVFGAHNASTERLGMAFTVCAYLRRRKDPQVLESLKRFAAFYEREIYDPETGKVYHAIRRYAESPRLYNAPWVATLMSEFYAVFGEKRYLEIMMRMMRVYYQIGGLKFYPNGLLMYQQVMALRDAGMNKEAEELIGWFKQHVDNMLLNDLDYPAHEVVFEQTIVSPVVAYAAQLYFLTGEEKYREASAHHLKYLLRFNGLQPDCHLYRHPIRYWDVYWAGKTGIFGDTFPHYWSCLSAWSQHCCAEAVGDLQGLREAKEEMRNCFCLYNEKFQGTCGHLYPFMIDGIRCEKDDPWSNDQDFTLYFASKIFDDSFFRQ